MRKNHRIILIDVCDPDAHSMATSGRGSGVDGYNAQVDVDTEHHLIVAHERQLQAQSEQTLLTPCQLGHAGG